MFFCFCIGNAIAKHCSQMRGIVWLSESVSEMLSKMVWIEAGSRAPEVIADDRVHDAVLQHFPSVTTGQADRQCWMSVTSNYEFINKRMCLEWKSYVETFSMEDSFKKAPKANRAQKPDYVHWDFKVKMNSAVWILNLLYPSAGPVRSSQTVVPRNHSSVKRATRMDRKAQLSPNVRTHRRAPQSSSGPRQPERVLAGVPLLERRRQHYAKPQSDQRNRLARKLSKRANIVYYWSLNEMMKWTKL